MEADTPAARATSLRETDFGTYLPRYVKDRLTATFERREITVCANVCTIVAGKPRGVKERLEGVVYALRKRYTLCRATVASRARYQPMPKLIDIFGNSKYNPIYPTLWLLTDKWRNVR